MKCPHCNQEHPDDMVSCPVTGKKIAQQAKCSSCNKPVRPDWEYCGYCGQKLFQGEYPSTTQKIFSKTIPEAPLLTPELIKPKTSFPKWSWLFFLLGFTGVIFLSLVILIIFWNTRNISNVVPITNSISTGKISFVSKRDGNWEIYVMDADGNHQTRLTHNSGITGNLDPSWSPDGKKIAFVSNRDGFSGIYVMDADGNNQTRLPLDNSSDHLVPAWSPDGQKIAYTIDVDKTSRIWMMNSDGNAQIRLTNGPGYDSSPSWSPDGKKLAFSSNRDGNYEIYELNIADGTQMRLTQNDADDFYPSWSPDGQKIAFSSKRGGNRDIYVMDADGSNQTRITNNQKDNTMPSWAVNGSKIVFSSNRDGNLEIYMMNADGSNSIRLTNNPADDFFPTWSPFGFTTSLSEKNLEPANKNTSGLDDATSNPTPFLPTSSSEKFNLPANFLVDPNTACVYDMNEGYSCLDKDGWHAFGDKAFLNPKIIVPLAAECQDGSVYLGINNGLFLLRDGKLSKISDESRIAEVGSNACDKTKNLWTSYLDEVNHWDGTTWTRFSAKDHVWGVSDNDLINSIVIGPGGKVWLSTYGSIAVYDGQKWQVVKSGINYGPLVIDSVGRVWVVVNNRLMTYDGTNWVTIVDPPDDIRLISLDQNDHIWIGTHKNQIYILDEGKNLWILKGDDLKIGSGRSYALRSMRFDHQNRLWVTSDYGVGIYDGENWYVYRMDNADMASNESEEIIFLGDGPKLPAPLIKVYGSVTGKLQNVQSSKLRVEICLYADQYYSYGEAPPCDKQVFHSLTTMDEDGNFMFKDIPPGKYQIMLEKSPNRWGILVSARGTFISTPINWIEVKEGEETRLGEINNSP